MGTGMAKDMDWGNDEVFLEGQNQEKDENPFRRKSGLMRSPPLQRTSSLSEERARERTTVAQKGSKEVGTSGASNRSMSSDQLRRRDSIGRSPTRKTQKPPIDRSSSATRTGKEDRENETGDPDKGKAKRLREDSEDDLKELQKMFMKLKNVINDLQKEVHQNTRVEIKKGIKSAKGQADDIVRKWDALTSQLRERKKSKWTEEGDDDDVIVGEETGKVPKETRTIGTQTIGDTKTKEGARNMLESLEGIYGLEDFLKVESKAWNRNLFTITEVEVGNPATAESSIKVIMVDPENKEMNKGAQKLMKDRFPEIKDTRDDVEVLEQETRRRTSNRTVTSMTKLICVRLNGTIEDLWQKLVDIKEEAKHEETVALHQVNFISPGCLRKMTEWVFQGTSNKVKIYIAKGDKRRNEKETQKRAPPPKENETHALVVRQKGKSFSEILKDVNGRLKDTAAGEAIKGLRSTRDGELLVILDKNDESLNKVKEELSQGGQQREIRDVGKRRVAMDAIFIRGLDAEATQEDVNQALTGILGSAEEGQYKVGNLRPTRNDTQTVTISVAKPGARILKEIGTLKVGMVSCRVEPRIKIQTCNKCREYGHFAGECSGPDRNGECYNCGKEGHLAKDCKDKAACSICGVEGHRTGSGGCKAFRRALAWARREREMQPAEGAEPPIPQND